MIEVSNLSKYYGEFCAVRDLSFSVERGQVVGFLGPNGAGKSTTLRILAGFLGASTGDVTIAGHSLRDDPLRAKEKIGYMPETSPLYPEMRVGEYLRFRAELKRVEREARAKAIDRVIEDTSLGEVRDVLIGQLSKGFRQRVGLADALVGSPPVLLLDEPTAGLDPNQIRDFRALVARRAEAHTIFVSTHILSEVEATCSRAIVIARGEMVASGSIDEVKRLRRPSGIRLRLRGERKAIEAVLNRVDGVKSSSASDEAGVVKVFEVTFTEPQKSEAITERLVSAVASASIGVIEVVPIVPSLEQAFSELTVDEVAAPKPKAESVAKKKKAKK
jgi:ABC-2 type transport system ATP-binding protein